MGSHLGVPLETNGSYDYTFNVKGQSWLGVLMCGRDGSRTLTSVLFTLLAFIQGRETSTLIGGGGGGGEY